MYPLKSLLAILLLGLAGLLLTAQTVRAENPIVTTAYSADPSVFIDDDGTPYLIWAAGGPVLCKLTPDMKGLEGTPVPLKGFEKFFEGLWLFKRAGLYYVTYPAFLKSGRG